MDHPLAYTQKGDGLMWAGLALVLAAAVYFRDTIVAQAADWGLVSDEDGNGVPDSVDSIVSRL